ncbi:MAG: NUDIX hydrolase [Clostridiales bacterium]|nr:NUDIX hydrolase [Clostridiales bacterium]
MNIKETFKSKETVYTGKFISVEKRIYKLCNGKDAQRDIVVHPEACAVVALDSIGDIYLVEQYRAAFDKILLEIPAGKLDPGETPGEGLIRELKEETGLSAGKISHLTSIAVSPGFCTEIIHIYLAEDLTEGETNPDDDEYLLISKMSLKAAKKAASDGTFTDAKTITGILMACELKGI